MSKEVTKVKQSDISEQVLGKISSFVESGQLQLPKDYSPANALKAAFIMLQEQTVQGKPVLEVCTKASVSMALLKMCVQGLNPMKNQGYFIPYADSLQWSRSYQGSIALAKRVGEVESVNANIVYKDDKFSFSIDPLTGLKKIDEHIQKIGNIDNSKIVGAYAIVKYNNGSTDLEVMTIEEIEQAWKQGATKGASPAHKNFRQEMAKKTVINRACKGPINSSSDASIVLSGESEYSPQEETEDIIHEEITEETASVQLEIQSPEETEEPDF